MSTAEKWIPRGSIKEYIPCLDKKSTTLLNAFQRAPDDDSAKKLLDTLNSARRKLWISTVEELDFNHSSRKAVLLLRKLDLNTRGHYKKLLRIG